MCLLVVPQNAKVTPFPPPFYSAAGLDLGGLEMSLEEKRLSPLSDDNCAPWSSTSTNFEGGIFWILTTSGQQQWQQLLEQHRVQMAACSPSMALFLPDGVSTAKPEPVGSIFLCSPPLLAVCRGLGGRSANVLLGGWRFWVGELRVPVHHIHLFPWKPRRAAPWANL